MSILVYNDTTYTSCNLNITYFSKLEPKRNYCDIEFAFIYFLQKEYSKHAKLHLNKKVQSETDTDRIKSPICSSFQSLGKIDMFQHVFPGSTDTRNSPAIYTMHICLYYI